MINTNFFTSSLVVFFQSCNNTKTGKENTKSIEDEDSLLDLMKNMKLAKSL